MLSGLFAAPPAHADDVITLAPETNFTTNAVEPKLEIAYQFPAAKPLEYLRTQFKINGLWVEYNREYKSGTSGVIDIFKGKFEYPAGKVQARLYCDDPVAYSPEFTVTVEKATTVVGVGKTAYTYGSGVAFKATSWLYTFNSPYYQVDKRISVKWPTNDTGNYEIYLQRKVGTKWVLVETKKKYLPNATSTMTVDWTIKQRTAAKTYYRYVVPATDWTTGVTSQTFSITGKKQSPALKVSYSAASQKYKKTAVKLTISTKIATTGKAVIYDGTKKLATVTVKGGSAKYTLSKKLKKGSHAIKVKFTPTANYATFFNAQTSKARTIKVK
jgi:hypothetical protein